MVSSYIKHQQSKKFSGTCIKDTWTKPKGVGSRVGSGYGWSGGSSGGEMQTIILEQQ